MRKRLASYLAKLKPIIPFYPLTIPGSTLFALSLFLIGLALADGNPYSFLLASLLLAVTVVLAVVSRLQASRLAAAKIEWDTTAPVYARKTEDKHRVTVSGFRAYPFFRVHFILNGVLVAGRSAKLRYHREISGDGSEIGVPVRFPTSGIFHGRGGLAVKDVFGLTRGTIRLQFERSIVVRPALISDRDTPRVEAQKGDENKSRMKSSDIERYFMREYIPGDRHRDINWKASSRFSEIFTRISPVTQEKTKIITVHFRPYASMRTDTLRSVLFLDQCKSALLYFLRSIKKEHSEYQFSVYVGSDVRDLETEEDIDTFATEVASIHYRNPRGEVVTNPDDLHPDNVFIFTTSYDSGLRGFLSGIIPGARMQIYRVTIPEKQKNQPPVVKRPLYAGSNDPFIGGGWILKKDPLGSNPGLGLSEGILLEDDPLEVRIV